MKKLLLFTCITTAAAWGQYKLEPAGAPPADLTPAIRQALKQDGARIIGPKGAVCEVWLRAKSPDGGNSEQNVSFTGVSQGALLGVIRFPAQGADRRGQSLKPGLYTMRLSFYPIDGAHQGVAPTRDFVLLSSAASDTDLNAAPNYDQLVAMSKKAAGTTHPAILSVWKADKAGPDALKQEGEDWVLYGAVGDVPIAMIVVGAYAG